MPRKRKRYIHAGKQLRPPKAGEMQYRKILMAYVDDLNALFREIVAPVLKQKRLIAVTDAVGQSSNPGSANEIILAFSELFKRSQFIRQKTLSRALRYLDFTATSAKAKAEQSRKTFEESGFAVRQVGKIVEASGISDFLAVAAKDNAALITNMADEYIAKIEKAVLDDYLWGKHGKEAGGDGLMNELQRIYGMTEKRARLIARDQNNKLHGSMNAIRAQAAGAIGYRWHNVGDQRVRGNPNGIYPDAKSNHWERQGNYYLYSRMENPPIAPDGKPFRQPPEGGFPGSEINCRCFQEPVFELD